MSMTDSVLTINRGKQLMHVLKEVRAAQKNQDLAKTTEIEFKESDLSRYYVTITPVEGLYEGITIKFVLTVPQNYPAAGHPIQPKCLTDIYHPNLHSGGRVCLHLDGVGNFESGFKETLESLLYGLNYLFLQPGNVSADNMKEKTRQTYVKNLEQFKIKKELEKKNHTVTIREFYSEDLNPSLSKVEDIDRYFPSVCMSRDSLERYVIFTLGGKKEMSLAKIETIISQLMRDPRYEYVKVAAPRMYQSGSRIRSNEKSILAPAHSHQVTMSRFSKIVTPTDMILSYHRIRTSDSKYQIGELYETGVSIFDAIYQALSDINQKEMKVITNIRVESNYSMVLGMTFVDSNGVYTQDGEIYEETQNGNNVIFRPMRAGKVIKIDILPIMPYQDPTTNKVAKPMIYIGNEIEKTPHILPYFKIEYSAVVYGKGAYRNFTKSCFKLDPTDPNSPYLKLRRLKKYMAGENEIIMRRNGYRTYDRRVAAVSDFRELTEEEHSFLNDDQSAQSVLENRDQQVMSSKSNEETDPTKFEDRQVGDMKVMSEAEIDQLFKMIGGFDNDIIQQFADHGNSTEGGSPKIPRKRATKSSKTKSSDVSAVTEAKSTSESSENSETFADIMNRYIASNVDETGLDIAGIRTAHDANRRRRY